MARRNTTGAVVPNYTPRWTAVTEWEGFNPSDPIIISGERGNFTFISAHIIEGEVVSVNVHGGTHGNTCFRSFYPNRVSKPKVKRRRKVKFNEDETE